MLSPKQTKYHTTENDACSLSLVSTHSRSPSGRGDRGAADVRQEGAGPIGGGQPETTEGREGGETVRAAGRQ